MARFGCKCGETLWNGQIPNDIQLRVFTDKEWDAVIELGMVDTLDLPDPKHDVWRCPKCERIYVFGEKSNSVIKTYKLED